MIDDTDRQTDELSDEELNGVAGGVAIRQNVAQSSSGNSSVAHAVNSMNNNAAGYNQIVNSTTSAASNGGTSGPKFSN